MLARGFPGEIQKSCYERLCCFIVLVRLLSRCVADELPTSKLCRQDLGAWLAVLFAVFYPLTRWNGDSIEKREVSRSKRRNRQEYNRHGRENKTLANGFLDPL